MITGAAAYPWVSRCSFLMPWLIFAMLLLTFLRTSPRDIRLHRAHLWLLLIQIGGSLAVYLAIGLYHPVVAQGAFICVLIPTATAAAVITGLLGGNVPFLTTYVLLGNVAVAVAAPLLLPLIGPHGDIPFAEAFLRICRETGPILLLPLLFAWTIRYATPRLHARLTAFPGLTFYLWAIALTVVTGKTVSFFAGQDNPDYKVEAGLAAASLLICVGQFIIGRRIGRHYGDAVSGGQGLGQKNTILAMWMAQAYLDPLSSVAPAAYILWQNLINSWQLWRKKRS
ncbi:MAG: transporter [Tannerellaceae bacterium]|nr:transporter [Tannerellaceae bacterium]